MFGFELTVSSKVVSRSNQGILNVQSDTACGLRFESIKAIGHVFISVLVRILFEISHVLRF